MTINKYSTNDQTANIIGIEYNYQQNRIETQLHADGMEQENNNITLFKLHELKLLVCVLTIAARCKSARAHTSSSCHAKTQPIHCLLPIAKVGQLQFFFSLSLSLSLSMFFCFFLQNSNVSMHIHLFFV